MYKLGEKVVKVCAFILFLLCAYKAVFSISKGASGGATGAIAGVLETAVWAVFAGIILASLFLGKISEAFTNVLFGGREKLDKVPMLLSHVRGFIAAGEYDEAAIAIQEFYAQDPLSPELNLLMFEFYLDNCGKREFAKSLAENYLNSVNACAEENLLILLRYCDLCLEDGMDRDELTDFLLDQSVKKIYSDVDKKRIFARVKGLNS